MKWRWRSRPRVSGPPPSANGASSFHLWWEVPGPFVEVAATLEIVQGPTVPRLVFWALQVSFVTEGSVDGRAEAGGAHLGLQAHPRHPGGTAVNWGGYRAGGGELKGSTSLLPSALGNANTRDFAWQLATSYRLRVSPAVAAGGWQGEVTDLASGAATVVRTLSVDAPLLSRPGVWTESFAHCDDPSMVVRWSDFEAVTPDGRRLSPSGVGVTYQSADTGGCANNTVAGEGAGRYLQVTSVDRTVPHGARLSSG